jgi:micrococcal nuclease
LNFHKDWRKYFTTVIFSSDFDKFPPFPEEYYLHRVVRITGLIKEYRGKPEIILKSPSQIEIIE